MTKVIKRLDLLLREVQDPYAQENFLRLKRILEDIELSGNAGPPGPPGPPGVPGTSGDAATTVLVPATSTVTVLSTPYAGFSHVDASMGVADLSKSKSSSFKTMVNRQGAVVQDSVYARLGYIFNYTFDVQLSGANMEYVVQNNEAFDIYFSYKNLYS